MIGAQLPELTLDRVDPAVEIVDHRHRAQHAGAPRLGELKALEQLAAAGAEKV